MEPVDPVQRVTISGPVLASLMEDMSTGDSDSDGLLFGRIISRQISLLQDHGEEQGFREECSAAVTSFCSLGRLMSFYNGAGAIEKSKLLHLMENRGTAGDPLIGWFMRRRNTPLRPSMRETAVSAQLRKVSNDLTGGSVRGVPSTSPLLFLLFTTSRDAYHATHTYEFRAFQYIIELDQHALIEPLSVSVSNLGPAFRGQYDSFAPTAAFPYLSRIQEPENEDHPPQAMDDAWARAEAEAESGREDEIATAAAQEGLDRLAAGFTAKRLQNLIASEGLRTLTEMETLFETMLDKLDILTKDVSQGSLAVRAQMEANARLQTSLRRFDYGQ